MHSIKNIQVSGFFFKWKKLNGRDKVCAKIVVEREPVSCRKQGHLLEWYKRTGINKINRSKKIFCCSFR